MGVLGVVLLICAPVLGSGFLTDDHFLIEHGRLVGDPSLAAVVGLLTHDTLYNHDPDRIDSGTMGTYRPLPLVVFWLERRLFDLAPTGYHAVNLTLHLLCVALLSWLVRRLSGDGHAALLAAFVLGVHPAVAEAWTWVNGVCDLLQALGVLGALACFERGRALAGAACLFAACCSKEVGLVAAPLLAVRPRWPTDPAETPPFRLRPPAQLAAIGGVLAAIFGLRAAFLPHATVLAASGHVAAAAAVAPGFVGLAALDLLLPVHAAERYMLVDTQALGTLGNLGLALLAVGVAAWLARAWRTHPARLWYATSAVACMLPCALTIPVEWGHWGGGRYRYLPLALLLGALAPFTWRLLSRRSAQVVLGAWLVLLCIQAENAIEAHADEESYGRVTSQEFPERSHGWQQLGLALCLKGRLGEGRRALERAVALRPTAHGARHNLVRCTLQAGDPQRALALARQGQVLTPRPELWVGASLALAQAGDRAGAIAEAERGRDRFPKDEGLAALLRALRDR